jgi:hypothetical protein
LFVFTAILHKWRRRGWKRCCGRRNS